MAEVVESIPRGRFGDYSKFFDGQPWKLILGVDCPEDINIAQNSIRITAKRAGVSATIRQSKKDNAIYVQAHVRPAKRVTKRK